MPTSPMLRLSDILGPDSRILEILALALLASALWLATHPYIGIYHDAIIYSLLAARWIDPSSYVNDVFFIFGSQDDLNLFTPLFGGLVSVLGLDLANRLVTLLGGGVWVAANSLLAYRVFGFRLPFRFVVLAAAATSLSYSPNGATFVLNENFATARSVAMPLVVFGIWADLSRRRLLAVATMAAATLLHPLLGIWGMLAFICIRLPDILLAAGVLLGVALVAFNDTYPLSRHLMPMSFEWAEVVRYTSPDVFFSDSASVNIGRFLWWVGVLWAGALLGCGTLRRYYLALALMTAWATLLSLYCSYVTPVALFVQIQPWRILWLAIALGWVALADIAWCSFRRGPAGRLALGLILIALYLAGRFAWCFPMALAIVFGSSVGRAFARRMDDLLVTHRRFCVLFLCGLAAVLLPAYVLDLEMLGLSIPGNTLGEWQLARGWVLGGGLGAGLLFMAWVCGFRLGGFVTLGASAFFMASGLLSWDVRSPSMRFQEQKLLTSGGDVHPFAIWVKSGDVVAWPGHEFDVWFVLHAANYASTYQAIGIVFSEQKACDIRNRLERVAAASSPPAEKRADTIMGSSSGSFGLADANHRNLRRYVSRDISAEGAVALCKDVRLDWLVSPHSRNGNRATKALTTVVDSNRAFYLYSCDDFR